MWSGMKKNSRFASILGGSLLIIFTIAILGCGSGAMVPDPGMHGQDAECSSMFKDTFAVSHKELRGIALVFLFVSLLAFTSWEDVFVRFLAAQRTQLRMVLYARSMLMRLHDYVMQQFSAGILHPKVY